MKGSIVRSVAVLGIATVLAAPSALPAQGETRFTAAQATRDINILVRGLRELHPGLYRYITPPEFDSAVAKTRARLANGGTRSELFLAMTRLAAAVRCGHTWTNPLNQADALQRELFSRADKLPFRLALVEDRFLVTASATDGVAAGDELLSIDGVLTREIVSELMPLVRADGASDGKRRAQLSHLFQLSAMDMYFPLLHPPKDGAYRVTVQRAGGKGSSEQVVRALSPAGRDSALRARGATLPTEAWTFAIRGDTGTMTLPTFVIRDGFDWYGWVRSKFAELDARRTGTLVIDIRQNEGGDSEVVDSILTYIAASPYAKPRSRPESAYERVPYVLARFLDTWDFGFFDRTGKVQKTDGRNWIMAARAVRADTLRPNAARYRGRTFLLVGPENSSAGYLMARYVSESKAATVVGQPTGGNLRGLNGGELAWLTLPNSGVAVDIPLIASMPLTPQPDAPVVPDVVVPHRFADVQRGIDPDMDMVRALLRRKR